MSLDEADLVYLFGYPVSTSVSPKFHTLLFSALSLPTWSMSLIDSTDVQDLIRLFKKPSFRGAAITLPYKAAMASVVDRLTEDARLLDSVNTIYIKQEDTQHNLAIGTNTDWVGIKMALAKVMTVEANLVGQDIRAAVLGKGILRRTAIYALARGLKIKRICIVGRKEVADFVLQEALKDVGADVSLTYLETEGQIMAINSPMAIIVNAARQTRWDDDSEQLSRVAVNAWSSSDKDQQDHSVVLDMSYLPPTKTELVHRAEEAGWPVASFLDFMVYQAAQQSSLWTGIPIEDLPLRDAAQALAGAMEAATHK